MCAPFHATLRTQGPNVIRLVLISIMCQVCVIMNAHIGDYRSLSSFVFGRRRSENGIIMFESGAM